MKRLREKLHSQCGATLLLALLFFLVCVLVAASVLMAAVSNAGKIRSNYEEQQKYLALSSALRLVSDQIEEAEYTGDYTVYEWSVEYIVGEGEDKQTIIIDYFHVSQTEGKFTCGELTGTEADTVLDFSDELDGLYAKKFNRSGYTALGGASLPATRELTVTVGSPLEEKFPEVNVKVVMDQNYNIHLTATMAEGSPGEGGKTYKMEAELAANINIPAIEYSPGGRNPGSATAPEAGKRGKYAVPIKPDVTWKLDWIDKEAAAG